MRVTHVLVPCLVAAAFALGQATASPPATAAAGAHAFTARLGDTVRVPGAATRCLVSQEAGSVDLLCNHTPRPRYQVVFFKDNLFVYRLGNPDDPVFSARGKP